MIDRRRSKKAPKVSPDADDSNEPTFEEALQRLESIVDRLEEGDLELEAALADFEAGVKLTRRCAGQLEDAERRIEVLVREGEKWIARPFAESEESD
jgi:exodeoxyribonuclease VII small subunit